MSTTASSSVAAGSLASVHGPCVMSLYTHFAMHRSCMSRTLELQPSGRAASLMSVARMSRSAAMSRTVMSSVRLFFTTRYRMSSESGSGIDERAAPRSKCSNRPNVERTSTCLHKVLQAGVNCFHTGSLYLGITKAVPLSRCLYRYRYVCTGTPRVRTAPSPRPCARLPPVLVDARRPGRPAPRQACPPRH